MFFVRLLVALIGIEARMHTIGVTFNAVAESSARPKARRRPKPRLQSRPKPKLDQPVVSSRRP